MLELAMVFHLDRCLLFFLLFFAKSFLCGPCWTVRLRPQVEMGGGEKFVTLWDLLGENSEDFFFLEAILYSGPKS